MNHIDSFIIILILIFSVYYMAVQKYDDYDFSLDNN